jgi:transcriptional regulator with XRE-family HTH domain
MSDHSIDPAVFERTDMRSALARRDIGAVYRILVDVGIPQRRLAELVGQNQSEVSEILGGREVQSYPVLERIAAGLGMSPGAMGMAYVGIDEGTPIYDEVDEDVKRRALLAAGAVALFGSPILGELLELPKAPAQPTPLPTSLSQMDIDAIKRVTRALEAEAQYYGGGGTVITPVAQCSERLLQVPATDVIKTAMATAIADLHNVAGWAAYDSRSPDTARYHFSRAMTLGNEGDGYEYARAAYLAGVSAAEQGAFNDGLKFLQLGQMRLEGATKTKRSEVLRAWSSGDSACILAHMDQRDQARKSLAAALDIWEPPDADDQAEMDWLIGLTQIQLGDLNAAQRSVATSLNHWRSSADRRAGVLGEITMASLYVRAGDSNGTERAYRAINQVHELRSMRARERLEPLAQALETRKDNQSRELARLARQEMTVA